MIKRFTVVPRPERYTSKSTSAAVRGSKMYDFRCVRTVYNFHLYHEMLSVLVDAWGGDSDSFLSGILHGMARFLALYQGEYSRERLVGRLRTVHPKTITRLAQNDTGNVADRHMKQILSIYNGAGRTHNLPCKR